MKSPRRCHSKLLEVVMVVVVVVRVVVGVMVVVMMVVVVLLMVVMVVLVVVRLVVVIFYGEECFGGLFMGLPLEVGGLRCRVVSTVPSRS